MSHHNHTAARPLATRERKSGKENFGDREIPISGLPAGRQEDEILLSLIFDSTGAHYTTANERKRSLDYVFRP
jgi:hypothetical protein